MNQTGRRFVRRIVEALIYLPALSSMKVIHVSDKHNRSAECGAGTCTAKIFTLQTKDSNAVKSQADARPPLARQAKTTFKQCQTPRQSNLMCVQPFLRDNLNAASAGPAHRSFLHSNTMARMRRLIPHKTTHSTNDEAKHEPITV